MQQAQRIQLGGTITNAHPATEGNARGVQPSDSIMSSRVEDEDDDSRSKCSASPCSTLEAPSHQNPPLVIPRESERSAGGDAASMLDATSEEHHCRSPLLGNGARENSSLNVRERERTVSTRQEVESLRGTSIGPASREKVDPNSTHNHNDSPLQRQGDPGTSATIGDTTSQGADAFIEGDRMASVSQRTIPAQANAEVSMSGETEGDERSAGYTINDEDKRSVRVDIPKSEQAEIGSTKQRGAEGGWRTGSEGEEHLAANNLSRRSSNPRSLTVTAKPITPKEMVPPLISKQSSLGDNAIHDLGPKSASDEVGNGYVSSETTRTAMSPESRLEAQRQQPSVANKLRPPSTSTADVGPREPLREERIGAALPRCTPSPSALDPSQLGLDRESALDMSEFEVDDISEIDVGGEWADSPTGGSSISS